MLLLSICLTLSICQVTVSKLLNTESDVTQCTHPFTNSRHAWRVFLFRLKLFEWINLCLSKCLSGFALVRLKLYFLFLEQPTFVIYVWVTEGGWASPAIHYPELWNSVYSLRLNVAAWIPNAPPLILSCWDITASSRIKTWLMAKVKSSHPVTTCQLRSMWWGLAVLQYGQQWKNPFEGFDRMGASAGKMGRKGSALGLLILCGLSTC